MLHGVDEYVDTCLINKKVIMCLELVLYPFVECIIGGLVRVLMSQNYLKSKIRCIFTDPEYYTSRETVICQKSPFSG